MSDGAALGSGGSKILYLGMLTESVWPFCGTPWWASGWEGVDHAYEAWEGAQEQATQGTLPT